MFLLNILATKKIAFD